MTEQKLKPSPLGPIPEDWEILTFNDILEITSSKRIFMSEYESSGIPFYRGKEIIEKSNGGEVSTDLFISEEKFNEIDEKFGSPKGNDILLSSVGTLGVPYLVKKSERFYFKDGNITWFRNYSDKIFPKFLFYWIISPEGKQQILGSAIGSTQQALTIVSLKNTRLALPKIEEQHRIAEILSSLDDKIELNRQMNKTLESIAQAIFKEWFVDFRFPGHEKVKMIESEMGRIPEGWEIKRLDDVADITIGRTPPRKEEEWFSADPKDIKWISIRDMGNTGVYIDDTAEYLTAEAAQRFNIPIIPKNTVVISFKLTVGRVAITTEEMLSNEAIAHIKLKTPYLSSEYIYLFIKNYDFSGLGSTSSIATAVNSKSIKGIEILVPKDSIANNFSKIISPMFDDILSNQKQIKTLSQLRDALLPRLMSGRVRVC